MRRERAAAARVVVGGQHPRQQAVRAAAADQSHRARSSRTIRRPRRRPEKLHADKGYDFRRCRAYLHRRGIKVRIARRGIEDKSKLGRIRWVVERTISWLLRFKRLGLRYDRTERTTLPLLILACAVINVRRLIKTEF